MKIFYTRPDLEVALVTPQCTCMHTKQVNFSFLSEKLQTLANVSDTRTGSRVTFIVTHKAYVEPINCMCWRVHEYISRVSASSSEMQMRTCAT